MSPAPPPTVSHRPNRPPPRTLVPRPSSQGQRTLKKNAALPSAPTPCIAYAPSGAATFPIHSTTSSARDPVDIGAAPVDHRQRERPRPLEQPRNPQPHNPPCERLKGRRSLRLLRPHFRQVPKTYASVTTSAPVNPPSLPLEHHRTCPHIPFNHDLLPRTVRKMKTSPPRVNSYAGRADLCASFRTQETSWGRHRTT